MLKNTMNIDVKEIVKPILFFHYKYQSFSESKEDFPDDVCLNGIWLPCGTIKGESYFIYWNCEGHILNNE